MEAGVERKLDKFVEYNVLVNKIESQVKSLTCMPLADRIETLSDVENAQLNANLLYMVNGYLKLNDVDVGEHGIMRELNSIKDKFKQIKKAKLKGKGPKVNVEVAGRLIRHALSQPVVKKRKEDQVNVPESR